LREQRISVNPRYR